MPVCWGLKIFICFFSFPFLGKLITLRNKQTKLQATWTKSIALVIPTNIINPYKQTIRNYPKKKKREKRLGAQPCEQLYTKGSPPGTRFLTDPFVTGLFVFCRRGILQEQRLSLAPFLFIHMPSVLVMWYCCFSLAAINWVPFCVLGYC